MGLGGKGKQVLYQCTGLSRVDIADIARGLVRNDSAGRPVIDVDANNLFVSKVKLLWIRCLTLQLL